MYKIDREGICRVKVEYRGYGGVFVDRWRVWGVGGGNNNMYMY